MDQTVRYIQWGRLLQVRHLLLLDEVVCGARVFPRLFTCRTNLYHCNYSHIVLRVGAGRVGKRQPYTTLESELFVHKSVAAFEGMGGEGLERDLSLGKFRMDDDAK
uniref:Uncharacterized protein n=1 Tax=Parascaris equorum TaxID=6256 RepID=A0A914S3L8_PAREQ